VLPGPGSTRGKPVGKSGGTQKRDAALAVAHECRERDLAGTGQRFSEKRSKAATSRRSPSVQTNSTGPSNAEQLVSTAGASDEHLDTHARARARHIHINLPSYARPRLAVRRPRGSISSNSSVTKGCLCCGALPERPSRRPGRSSASCVRPRGMTAPGCCRRSTRRSGCGRQIPWRGSTRRPKRASGRGQATASTRHLTGGPTPEESVRSASAPASPGPKRRRTRRWAITSSTASSSTAWRLLWPRLLGCRRPGAATGRLADLAWRELRGQPHPRRGAAGVGAQRRADAEPDALRRCCPRGRIERRGLPMTHNTSTAATAFVGQQVQPAVQSGGPACASSFDYATLPRTCPQPLAPDHRPRGEVVNGIAPGQRWRSTVINASLAVIDAGGKGTAGRARGGLARRCSPGSQRRTGSARRGVQMKNKPRMDFSGCWQLTRAAWRCPHPACHISR
jgi:hypothetical protein